MNPLDREAELKRMLDWYGANDANRVFDLMDRQFVLLHNRAQVLLGLTGVVITTTGFSGRIIAGTNALAQGLIIGGVALTLLAAVVVVCGVLQLNWLTQLPGTDVEAWLRNGLARRDQKTKRYRLAIVLLLIGLALYVGAIAVMLLNPHVGGLPAR